jgi:hypothetical protein
LVGKVNPRVDEDPDFMCIDTMYRQVRDVLWLMETNRAGKMSVGKAFVR